jgi:hypothetical protein
VKPDPSIKLPVAGLLELFLSPNATAMSMNFALVYLKIGFERMEPKVGCERFWCAGAV